MQTSPPAGVTFGSWASKDTCLLRAHAAKNRPNTGSVSKDLLRSSWGISTPGHRSLRCDCRLQLELALSKISQEGAGILLYEQQEGRGIGLMAKLRAYELQDHGRDTVEANEELGYAADCREFELPAEVLKMLGVAAVRLITNNPEKVAALETGGIAVVERVSAEVVPQESFEKYLKTKHEKMGHIVESLVVEEQPH
jgi:GTP cyclohydrolase II